MKKIIIFYLFSCLSTILTWLAIDDYNIESKDFKFGFYVLIFVTCTVYAPICTITACFLYYSKINKTILLKKWLCVLYCMIPFLCFKILGIIYVFAGVRIDYKLEYIIPIVFIIQNIIIILKRLFLR